MAWRLGTLISPCAACKGKTPPLSATTVARLKAQWHAEWQAWASRPLADLEVVYLWVDGVYVKAGLEQEKAVVLVVLVVLAGLSDGPQGSHRAGPWISGVDRGLQAPKLVIGNGHWVGLRNVYRRPKSSGAGPIRFSTRSISPDHLARG